MSQYIYHSDYMSKNNLILTSHEIDLTQIKTVTCSDTLTIIEPNTFDECSNLTKITFSKNLRKIGDNAFNGCGQLKEIFFNGPRHGLSLELGTDCFNNIHEKCSINYGLTDFNNHFLNDSTNVTLLYRGGYTQNFVDDNAKDIDKHLSGTSVGWIGSGGWVDNLGIFIGPHITYQEHGSITKDADRYYIRNSIGDSVSKYAIISSNTYPILNTNRGNVTFEADFASNTNLGVRFIALVNNVWYGSKQFGTGTDDHGDMTLTEVISWETILANIDKGPWYKSLAGLPDGYEWRNGYQWETIPIVSHGEYYGGLPSGDITQYGFAWLQTANNHYGAMDNFRVVTNFPVYTYFKLTDGTTKTVVQDDILKYDTNDNNRTSLYNCTNNSTGVNESTDIKTISEIHIGNNITEISDFAFRVDDNYSTAIVYIPTSVTIIGVGAFSANKINYFVFMDIDNSQLKTIEVEAFWYTDLKTFTIPSSVTSIGSNAFHGANHGGLKTIYFHDIDNSQLEYIGPYAFMYLYNDVNSDIYIKIPKNVNHINKGAYYRNSVYNKNVYFYGNRPLLNTIHQNSDASGNIAPEVFEFGSGAKIIVPNFLDYPEYASSWEKITSIDGYPVEQNSS